MPATLMPGPVFQPLDVNGNPYPGAKVFFYESGTSTKQNTYQDSGLVTPHANPVILDSAGRATIYLRETLNYKLVLAPSTDTDPPVSPIFTVDPVGSVPVARGVQQLANLVTTTGNVGTGEDVLFSYVAPAGLLSANGAAIEGFFYGNTANNANTKTLRVRIIEGANNNLLIQGALTISQAGKFVLQFQIIRASAITMASSVIFTVGPANGPSTVTGTNLVTGLITWANSVEVRITGEATTTNDMNLAGGVLKGLPVPS